MNKTSASVIVGVLVLVACSSLPYQDDKAFAVSAQANSPEFPVYVGGAICKDMDGNPGMCSKKITSSEGLILHIDAQNYPYNVAIQCTNPITVPGASVPSGAPFDLTLHPEQMQGLVTFICRGEVFPQDRPQPLSASFEVRVNVSDSAYVPREGINTIENNRGQTVLVLGEYARDSWVCDGGVCNRYKKATTVKIRNPGNVSAYSSSYDMRFNYFHWSSPTGVD